MWIGRSYTRGCDCSSSSDARLSTSVAAGVVISPRSATAATDCRGSPRVGPEVRSELCNRCCRFRHNRRVSSRRTSWVLLAYRLPRDPSTPRSALWRKLRRIRARDYFPPPERELAQQAVDALAALVEEPVG